MNAPTRISPDRIDEVRARTVMSRLVGQSVKLKRAGRLWKGLCPFHSERTPSFTVDDDKGTYHCFGCAAHGGAIDFVMAAERCDFRDAFEKLAGDAGIQFTAPAQPKEGPRERTGSDRVNSDVMGRWLFRNSRPARGTIVEAWLRVRGLDLEAFGLGDGIDRLRFMLSAPYFPWREDEAAGSCRLRAPAMIAPIVDNDGHVRAVHVTYLAADGAAKADLGRDGDGEQRDARKIFGRYGQRAVWLSGGGRGGSTRPLIVGEGIETVWSYAQSLGGYRQANVAAAAALSLGNMEGAKVTRSCRDGTALQLWKVRPDLDRPGFLIENANDVTILVDADMKPLRNQLVQFKRGGPFERADIDQAMRAQICAEVTVQRWRAAGALPVKAVRPPMGLDFNDMVRR